MRVIDISRALTPEIAVWPGDQPFEREWTLRIANGSTVNLSAVHLSTHTGTHADAPLHYMDDGLAIHEIPFIAIHRSLPGHRNTQSGSYSSGPHRGERSPAGTEAPVQDAS